MEVMQRKSRYAHKAFASKVIVLISKKKRDKEKKRSELYKAMEICSIDRLAAVISSAKVEFGDELKDLCEDAEAVLKALLRKRSVSSSLLEDPDQQQVKERKTLREKLLASDFEVISPVIYSQDNQTSSMSVDAETSCEMLRKLPAGPTNDDTLCQTVRFSMSQDFLKFPPTILGPDQVSDCSSRISSAKLEMVGIIPHAEEHSVEYCSAPEPLQNYDLKPRLSLGALLWQEQGVKDGCEDDSMPLPFTIDSPYSNRSSLQSFYSDVGQNSGSSGSPIHSFDTANSHVSGDAGDIDNHELLVFGAENHESNHSSYYSLQDDTINQPSPPILETEPLAQSRYGETFISQTLQFDNISPPRVSLMTLLRQSDGDGGNFIIMDPDQCTSAFLGYWSEGDEIGFGEEMADLDPLCCVCMLARKGAAFIPCGHTFCRKCSRKLLMARGTCPLCNKEIREYLNIY